VISQQQHWRRNSICRSTCWARTSTSFPNTRRDHPAIEFQQRHRGRGHDALDRKPKLQVQIDRPKARISGARDDIANALHTLVGGDIVALTKRRTTIRCWLRARRTTAHAESAGEVMVRAGTGSRSRSRPTPTLEAVRWAAREFRETGRGARPNQIDRFQRQRKSPSSQPRPRYPLADAVQNVKDVLRK